jgi:hypothetical protein
MADSTAGQDPIVLPLASALISFMTLSVELCKWSVAKNVTVIREPDQLSKEDHMDSSKSHGKFHILEKGHFLSSAVVSPRHVPDVQDMMRLENEFEIPLRLFSKAEILVWRRCSACPWYYASIQIIDVISFAIFLIEMFVS